MAYCYVNNIYQELQVDWSGQDLIDDINAHTGSNYNRLLLGGKDITGDLLSDSGVCSESHMRADTEMVLVEMMKPRREELFFPKHQPIHQILEKLEKIDDPQRKIYSSKIFPDIKNHLASDMSVCMQDDSIWCEEFGICSVEVRMYCKTCRKFVLTTYCRSCAPSCPVCHLCYLECMCE